MLLDHWRRGLIVRDNNGQTLSYVYYEQESGRRTAAGLLTRDEARRIAVNIAKRRSCCANPWRQIPRRKRPTSTSGPQGKRRWQITLSWR
jgi:hypothetical protein